MKKSIKRKNFVDLSRYGMIFIAPFFIVFAIFQLFPLLYTFYESLDYTFKNGRKLIQEFGLGNYTNYVFGKAGGGELWYALAITVVLWILNFIPQILLSLLLAAWFTDIKYNLKKAGLYKVIMYMPNIITAATIAVLFYGLFATQGPITILSRNLGLVGKNGFLNSGWASLLIIAFIQFWMWYGNTMIVLCAGIMGISPSLYEAAMVDGATSRQQFFKITMPLLKPILQFTLVTSAIGGLQMYDIPQLFNKGGPIVKLGSKSVMSTRTVVMLIKTYVSPGPTQNYGRAAAYSVVLFVVTLCVSLIFYKATSEKKDSNGR